MININEHSLSNVSNLLYALLNPDIGMYGEEGNEDTQKALLTFKCPKGHEYEAPEPFILVTPDLACNSGPLCVYCYVTWLHVNLGTEEIVARG